MTKRWSQKRILESWIAESKQCDCKLLRASESMPSARLAHSETREEEAER